MAIADLSNVLDVFRRGQGAASNGEELFTEVLLMTLARATSSDANIDPCEVSTVLKILKEETGQDFTEADIRKASRPTLFDDAPFSKYLASVRKRLDSDEISRIVQALARVIKSDTNVRELEIDFFNMVADSLRATPAETVGLVVS
ncbi:MAG: TerB family tellurite resistance protein [Woeseiaceae bacterium]|nr:TerB family tellurite resistance protein [Woeseiaceae bacterium]